LGGMRPPRGVGISERSSFGVKGLTLARDAAVYAGSCARNATEPHENSWPQDDQAARQARLAEAAADDAAWRRRARPLLVLWLRQSAGLSRLDAASSHRRRIPCPRRTLPIWPPRDPDVGGASG